METKKNSIISSMIALLPLLAFIRVPGISIGLGMVSLIILIPVLFIINERKISFQAISYCSAIIIFCTYSAIRSIDSFSGILGYFLVIIWMVGLYNNGVDEDQLFGVIKKVSYFASVIVIIQSLFHYLVGGHLVANLPFLLKDEIRLQYMSLISTGVDSTGIYRPSAFFLEPAHFSQYGIIALLYILLREKKDGRIKKAILISVGIALTLSGMGIVMVLGAWITFLALGLDYKKRQSFENALYLIVAGLIIVFFLSQLPLFQTALKRITGNETGYNAIWGRLFYWDYYFKPLQRSQLIWGLGYSVDTQNYMTGFMKLLYCSGYIGVVLFYFALLKNIRNRTKFSVITGLTYAAMTLFSGITATINLVFFLTVIFSTKRDDSKVKSSVNKEGDCNAF